MRKLPTYFFNELGLRFSVTYLAGLKNQILKLTLLEQAEFVDMVTYEKVKHNHNVYKADDKLKINYKGINTTTIGNLAFVSLYHNSNIQKNYAIELLERIKSYFL